MTTMCPKCGEIVTGVTVKEVKACALGGRTWQCVSLNCSRCNTSLGVQIDPLSIKATLIDEIRARI